jgi:phytoene synthase
MQAPADPSSNRALLAVSAREGEPDRYFAALLGPRGVRNDLIALAALTAEIHRIPRAAMDPHLAEIRLQWWRDALLTASEGATGNPIADAFRDVMRRHSLDRGAIEAWFDAFAHTFYAAAPDDEAHLALEHELVEGTPFALAAAISGAKPATDVQGLVRNAGIAYGLARLGLNFPHSLARGRMPLPGFADAATEAGGFDQQRARLLMAALARANMRDLSAKFPHLETPVRAALLPVALVEPYLQALETRAHDLARNIGEVAPLTRVWRIWRTHRTKRL